jgi:hypothetical protein
MKEEGASTNRSKKCYRGKNAPNWGWPAERLKILTDVANSANKLPPKKFDGGDHDKKTSINAVNLKHESPISESYV